MIVENLGEIIWESHVSILWLYLVNASHVFLNLVRTAGYVCMKARVLILQ